MESALTVMAIFTFSTLVVRIASTIMRLIGLPDHVARFQCLSALTGTGFTTRESELIVNYPIRRRVLMTLMIFGNLGLISISATFIVTFASIEPDGPIVLQQAAWLAGGLLLNFLFITHPAIDRILCSAISRVLTATTDLGDRPFDRLLSLEDDMAIAEHHLRLSQPVMIGDLIPDGIDLSVIMIRGEEVKHPSQLGPGIEIKPFETAICFGKEDMHNCFAKWLRSPERMI